MAKISLLEKMAQASFNSAAFQNSWNIHMQAFGPIMEPAFTDSYQAKVHLAAALGRMQKRDFNGAVGKLQEVQKHIETDADRAAWLFFMGLCNEMAGRRIQMLGFYFEAAKFEHKFYLPYLKIARCAHDDGMYAVADDYYVKAIGCLEGKTDAQSVTVLGSAYTNRASCLMMMRRFDESKEMFEKSGTIQPVQKGRAANEAILYAAMGDRARVDALMETVCAESAEQAEEIKATTEEILSGKNPHFTAVDTEPEAIAAFWKWFAENESAIISKLPEENRDMLFAMILPELQKLFPFHNSYVRCEFFQGENVGKIEFASGFSASLEKGLADMIAACPEDIKGRWQFEITQ